MEDNNIRYCCFLSFFVSAIKNGRRLLIKGDYEMDQLMTQNIKKDLIYYGVYSTSEDMWNGSDVLCSARKRFFESGTKQKKRSSIKSENITYNYSYSLESGVILKYKKMKGSRLLERVGESADGYYVEHINDLHRCVKKTYYNRMHHWLRTEYFNDADRSVEMLIAPADDSEKPSIACKTSSKTEILYPFDVSLDKELTQKLNILTSEPKVFCVTSCGSFYYCTQEEFDERKKALEKLIGEEKTKTEPDGAEQKTIKSDFVVDTSLLENSSSVVFDLRNSKEVRISEPQEEITETAVTSEQEIKKEKDEEKTTQILDDITNNELIQGEEAEPEKTDSKETSSAADKEPGSTEKKVTKRTVAKSAEDKSAQSDAAEKPAAKKTRRTKKTDTAAAEKPAKKKVQTSSEEAAEPSNQLMFGQETSVIPPLRERLCAFVNECPYETVDKQIIESGGKQYYYFGDISDDKRSGRGRTVMKNGETAYEGGYLDDKRDGFGVYYYKSGKLCYAGNWKQNKREGLGAAFSPTDGSVFVGKWNDDISSEVGSHYDSEGNLLYTGAVENGKKNGAGMTYNGEDKTFFIGKYKDGEFLETGTQFSSEGDLLYTGGYKGNARNGIGTAYLPDGGIKYKGGWFNNQYDGEGVLYKEDGSVIDGVFKNGKAHGKCRLTDADGRVIYIGSYLDDNYNGTGRLFLDDGGYAEGRFVDGEPTGIFNIYDSKKQLVYCGEWEGRQFCGRGTQYKDGEKIYEGEFRDSAYNGEGKLFEGGNAVYTGSFRNGRREGFGAEYSNNELKYKGIWKNDVYNGCGILYKNNEAEFVGMFSEGQMHGRINEVNGRNIIRKSVYTKGELTYTCEYSNDGSLSYYGNISGNMRNGMGCSFIANAEKQFEGIFKNNQPDKAMRVLLKDLQELPVCTELENTEYELYRITPEFIIEKNITIGEVSAIYSGRLKNGLPNGSGTILYSDHRYTGYFIDGKPEGEGIVYMRDGEECKGLFSSKPFSDCKTMILSDITYFYKEL